MTDEEKSEISFVVCTIYGILLHFTLFCCQICFFLAIYAVLSHYRFFRFTHYYVEKNLAKNSARGEKMTNMRYALYSPKAQVRNIIHVRVAIIFLKC